MNLGTRSLARYGGEHKRICEVGNITMAMVFSKNKSYLITQLHCDILKIAKHLHQEGSPFFQFYVRLQDLSTKKIDT